MARSGFATGTLLVALFSALGSVAKANVEDVLAGLSPSELNSLFNDLDYAQDTDSSFSYPQSLDDDYLLPVDLKHVDVRAAAGGGGKQQPPSAATTTTMLPAYCDPPNPCPPGYTSSDGCVEDFENTSEFSRNYQSTQSCICDTEHMFNCPTAADENARPRQTSAESNFFSNLPGLTAIGRENPFLTGTKLPVAAKKGGVFF